MVRERVKIGDLEFDSLTLMVVNEEPRRSIKTITDGWIRNLTVGQASKLLRLVDQEGFEEERDHIHTLMKQI